jgi:hypothetical protein
MVRRLVGAIAFVCFLGIVAQPVSADRPVTGAADAPRVAPMQFQFWHEGPASSCREKCRTWVSAVGMIRTDTVREFETFAENHDIHGATLVIDSEGGSVVGALALGRAVRKYEMTTTIGKTVELRQSKPDDRRAMLSPKADCESMCAFLMLAGTKRIVPTESRVRVHQIWLGDRREDATAATYSAEDLVLVQRDIGKLANYTLEMGGSGELLELSLRIPPWEPMRSLTRDELRRMKIDTSEWREASAVAITSEAPIEPRQEAERRAATTSAPPVNNIRRVVAAANERGWTIVRQPDTTALVRRHPLTAEGETLGSFDVMLTCGETPGEYSILYSETRRGRDRAPDPLKIVTVSLGQKSVTLVIGSSELTTPRFDRETLAGAILPASAVKTFAEAGAHSLIVSTSNGKGGATMVRVGNSGASQYFPQLVAACGQPRSKQAGVNK